MAEIVGLGKKTELRLVEFCSQTGESRPSRVQLGGSLGLIRSSRSNYRKADHPDVKKTVFIRFLPSQLRAGRLGSQGMCQRFLWRDQRPFVLDLQRWGHPRCSPPVASSLQKYTWVNPQACRKATWISDLPVPAPPPQAPRAESLHQRRSPQGVLSIPQPRGLYVWPPNLWDLGDKVQTRQLKLHNYKESELSRLLVESTDLLAPRTSGSWLCSLVAGPYQQFEGANAH